MNFDIVFLLFMVVILLFGVGVILMAQSSNKKVRS